MTAFRFVHSADVHLDSPLRSLALRDPALGALIGNATRQAFVRIIDLCLEEQVDALVLAGDLYDGDQTSMKTARFFAAQLRRLDEAGIRVFIVRGNHDALSRITKELTLPEGVTVFGGRAETILPERAGEGPPVAIHGLSFAQPRAPESLVAKYRPRVDGAVNIGILHTSLAGAPGHDNYAPCSIAELEATGFDYWALGHVHKRSVVQGKATIVMPGMPQGRDINEAGPKSATLVTVTDTGGIEIEERRTSIAQFERVSFDVSGIEDWRDLIAAFETSIERARAATVSDHLVARINVSGLTSMAWRLRADRDLLKTEMEERASVVGDCWIEQVDIECTPPGEMSDAPDNPIIEMRRLIRDTVVASEGFVAHVAAIAEELRAQLPRECRDLLGEDEAAFHARLADVIAMGADDVLARLHASAGTKAS
jgi:DNA repair exonuclease SbcCD nuclease subunit